MTLKSLVLQNFQVHKRLRIDFGPQVTTIVGPTDVGKSSVIRALRWIATNRPSGEAFIKDGEDNAKARIEFVGSMLPHSGTRKPNAGVSDLRRVRGKGKNVYVLNGKTFKAFGDAVPDEVAQSLSILTINFQGQHDAPFWFSETAGEVSRQLNQVVDLEVIDKVLADLSSRVKANRARLQTAKEREDSARTQVQGLKWVRHASSHYKKLETLCDRWERRQASHKQLHRYFTEAKKAQTRQAKLQDIITAGNKVIEAGDKWSRLAKERDRLKGLAELARQYLTDSQKVLPGIQHLEQKRDDNKALREEIKSLRYLLRQSQQHEETRTAAVEQAQDLKQQFKQQIGKVCPVCQQPVTTSSLF